VTINDTLALGFTLLALEWVYSERRWCPWAAPLLFAFAILSKESVILLPWCFVLWRSSGMTARRGMRRVIPMAAVSALAAAAFWMLRRGALAPTGAPYETRLGTNVLHNAAVYAGWLVSTAPVPELARYRELLPLALLLLGLTLVSYAACPACRRPLLAGAAWWLLAIAPVLVLVRSRYANYAYASLVGGYLVTVSVLACAGSWLAARRRPSAGARAAAALSVAALYVVLATGVLSAHLSAVVPGTELPRDPVLRGILVARQLVESFTREKQPEDTLVAIVAPPELQIALGARSGRRYRSPAGYDLLEAVSDSGRALRVFDPGVRDVAYVHDWQRHLRGRTIFVPFGPGYLYRAGRGTSGHLAAARLLVAARRADLALVYLDRAIAEDGPDSSLVELREVVRARRAPSPAP
jgi:hypothetical protein